MRRKTINHFSQLFIEKPIYDYGLLQEYALACEGLGMKAEAGRIMEQILANSNTPESVRI